MGLPGDLVPDDGVEDGEQLAHSGDEGHLPRIATPAQGGMEVVDGGLWQVAVTVAMYSIVRTEARPPQTRRGPRQRPLHWTMPVTSLGRNTEEMSSPPRDRPPVSAEPIPNWCRYSFPEPPAPSYRAGLSESL